jgi:hypothetical protein
VTPTGFEQAPDSAENRGDAVRRDAKSDALSGDSGAIAPDLAAVVAAWPRLPEAVRRHVLALVQEAKGGGC